MHHQFLELVTNRHILLSLINNNNNNSSNVLQENIIKYSNKKIIKLILEIIKNTINGNIEIKKEKITKLKRYKSVIRGLFKNKKNINKKRKTLIKIFKIIKIILKNFFISNIWKNISKNVE